jgi:hypothetical protein
MEIQLISAMGFDLASHPLYNVMKKKEKKIAFSITDEP